MLRISKNPTVDITTKLVVVSIAMFAFVFVVMVPLYNVIATIVAGKPTSDEKVWDGAEGLEWTVATPAPYHTFETPPAIR